MFPEQENSIFDCTCSLLVHSLILSFVRSFVRSFIRSCSFLRLKTLFFLSSFFHPKLFSCVFSSFVRSFIHSLTHSLAHSCSFVRQSVCFLVLSLDRSLVRSFHSFLGLLVRFSFDYSGLPVAEWLAHSTGVIVSIGDSDCFFFRYL